MKTNEDYELEEMENSAVKKSTMAKRAAAAAGLVGAGAASAYGAGRIINGGESEQEAELTTDDVVAGAEAGAVTEDVVEPAPEAAEPNQAQNVTHETTHTEEVHVYHHVVEEPRTEHIEEPKTETSEEPHVEYEKDVIYYDSEGNLLGVSNSGHIDGMKYEAVDVDFDGKVDVLLVDENGNQIYEENEVTNVREYGLEMAYSAPETKFVNVDTGEESVVYGEGNAETETYYAENQEDISDIKNDYYDQKAGEEYRGDLAENNPDYRNQEETDYYSVSAEKAEEGYELTEQEAELEISDESGYYAETVGTKEEMYVEDDYSNESDLAMNDESSAMMDDTAQYDVI